ncbi:MAG: FGGY-family carbohydrate kinase [Candidatus Sumerlaeota bacterium]
MRLNLELLHRSGIEIEELVATGGGARSRKWTQLKADVMGRPISTTPVSETGCLGGAILARAAAEDAPLQDIAREMTSETETLQPDPRRAEYYAERFETYEKLYPTLKSIRF